MENSIVSSDVDKIAENYTRHLVEQFDESSSYEPEAYYFKKQWQNIKRASTSITTWNTGIDYNILHYVGTQSVSYPKNFVSLFIRLAILFAHFEFIYDQCFRLYMCDLYVSFSLFLFFIYFHLIELIIDNSSAYTQNTHKYTTNEIGKWKKD